MDDHREQQWAERREYAVPTYQSPDTAAWYHFLHGNVPGHQIDFMYRPEVPQGPLTRQHFSHLARLMKYIEPHTHSEYAFALGNLSRDDTQYEPGHGGVALLFGFRLRGATDHAGRRDPPFAHAIATADRGMDYGALLSASVGLYQRLFGRGHHDGPSIALYREYVRCAAESPELIEDALRAYTAGFRDLPRPGPSSMGLRWITDGAPQPKRIAIVYPDSAPFSVLAETSARIAAMLYVSDVRWTAITSGRESDVPNGVTVRLVAQRDAATFEQGGGPMMAIEEVPDDEAEIAQRLFNARSAVSQAPVQGGGWRELYKGKGSRGSPSTPPPAAPPSDKGYGSPEAAPSSQRARYGSAGAEDRAPERPAPARMDDEPTRPWTGLSAGGNGAAPEPPRAFGESARFSPAEIRASIGAPEYSPPPPPVAAAPPPPVAAAPLQPQPPPPVAAAPQPPPQLPPQPPPQPPPKAVEPSVSKPRSEWNERAPGALSAEAAHPPAIQDPLRPAAPASVAREAIPAPLDRPGSSALDADFRPASPSRRNVYLGVLLGVGALAGVAYFGFMSGPPKAPAGVESPGPTAPPTPPTPQTTAADPPTAPAPERAGTPVDPAPSAKSDPSQALAAPTATGKRAASPAPSPPSTRPTGRIITEEDPEPKPKPPKPPTTSPRSPPTTSVFEDKALFNDKK